MTIDPPSTVPADESNDSDGTDNIGQWLVDQHANRQPYRSLRDRLNTLDEGYAAQQLFVQHLLDREGGSIAGYKIGLTTARMQAMCGITEPIAGVVLGSRVQRTGARVSLATYGRLGIESEVCVAFGSDLPANCTRAAAQAYLRSVHAAYELVDDRGADYSNLDAPTLVADNSWNAGVVIGGGGSPDLDLSALKGQLFINQQLNDSGSTGDAMGHPLDVVIWLVQWLGRRGKRLRAGEIVMTGSIVPTKFAKPGQHYHLQIEGLPPVDLAIDP